MKKDVVRVAAEDVQVRLSERGLATASSHLESARV